jgi:hypothetical protein
VKVILASVGVLLLVFVAYAAWVIIRSLDSTGLQPVTTSEVVSGKIRVTITMSGVDSDFQITEVIFPRDYGEQLEILAPTSFRLTPYTLQDTTDPNSDEAARWVESSNRRDLRWTGSVDMPPDVPVILEFPIRYKIDGTSTLRFQYERKIGMGGQISYFNVPVEITKD